MNFEFCEKISRLRRRAAAVQPLRSRKTTKATRKTDGFGGC